MAPSPGPSEAGTTNCPGRTIPAKPTIIKQGVYERQYHHSNPIGILIRDINKATVLMLQTTALVGSGAQMSAMTDSFAQQLGLPVQKLGKILNLEATRGG